MLVRGLIQGNRPQQLSGIVQLLHFESLVNSTTTENISSIGSEEEMEIALTTNDGSDDCNNAEHFDEVDE